MALLNREDRTEAGKEEDFWSKNTAGLLGGRLVPVLEDASSPKRAQPADRSTLLAEFSLTVPAGEGWRCEPHRCEPWSVGFFQIGRDPDPCSGEARERRGSDFSAMALSLIVLPKLAVSSLLPTGFF